MVPRSATLDKLCKLFEKSPDFFLKDSPHEDRFEGAVVEKFKEHVQSKEKDGLTLKQLADDTILFFMSETARIQAELDDEKLKRLEIGKKYALESKNFGRLKPLIALDLSDHEVEALTEFVETLRDEQAHENQQGVRKRKSS